MKYRKVQIVKSNAQYCSINFKIAFSFRWLCLLTRGFAPRHHWGIAPILPLYALPTTLAMTQGYSPKQYILSSRLFML